MTIGEATRMARKKAGITQTELAKRSGYSKDAISIIENDRKTPRITAIIDLADALGISVDEYVGHDIEVKRQIPKKPVENRFPWANCPTCGGSVYLRTVQEHIFKKENTYCEHCGQALDWSDNNG